MKKKLGVANASPAAPLLKSENPRRGAIKRKTGGRGKRDDGHQTRQSAKKTTRQKAQKRKIGTTTHAGRSLPWYCSSLLAVVLLGWPCLVLSRLVMDRLDLPWTCLELQEAAQNLPGLAWRLVLFAGLFFFLPGLAARAWLGQF